MSAEQQNWDKLVKLARQAPQAAEPEMPLGFATRVVANWPKAMATPSLEVIWEKLSLRVLGVAFAILLVTAGFSYNVIAADKPDVVQMTDSALGVVFEP